MEKRELVIIGAGPAGLSAAIYGKRAGLDTLVLETVSYTHLTLPTNMPV